MIDAISAISMSMSMSNVLDHRAGADDRRLRAPRPKRPSDSVDLSPQAAALAQAAEEAAEDEL